MLIVTMVAAGRVAVCCRNFRPTFSRSISCRNVRPSTSMITGIRYCRIVIVVIPSVSSSRIFDSARIAAK